MASSSTGSRLFALIIGIDDYTEEFGFPKLKGAVRDAGRIRNWLISDFSVPPSQIKDLRDKEATRNAIIEALKGLATDERIQRDDPILIYYAGHGTEAPAPKRWRWDSPQIQMIAPWDFKRRDGSSRITQGIPDRTLGVLLTKLAAEKGNNITVILDSCHSGSGTRSDSDTRVRGGPCEVDIPAELDEDLVLQVPSHRGARVPDKFRHHGLRSHVLLAACAPHERAHEVKTSGAFTEALLGALKGANTAELTYEGLIERMEILPSKVANTKPVLNATLKKIKNKLELTIAGAGAIHGISTGSEFAIWNSRSDLDKEPLAIVTVGKVKGHESVATLSESVATLIKSVATPSKKPEAISLVAQIKHNPMPKLSIHVPKAIQSMQCFGDLFSEGEGRRPLEITVTEDKTLASIGLTYLDELDEIGFELLKPKDQGQKIRHTIDPTAEDLHGALEHLCHYYYHRDRTAEIEKEPEREPEKEPGKESGKESGTVVIGKDKTPFSSKFTIDVFTLEENDEEIYVPSGPNLNIQGTGVELTVGPHNEEDLYGFRITNNTNFPVFPYLFYFDNSDFSITPIYQPVAVAQNGAKELSIPSLPEHESLAIGYGSAGATPQNLAISNVNLDLEQGHLYLYVSTRHVDLSFLKKGPISQKTRGFKKPDSLARRPLAPIWGLLTVPIVIKRGGESTPTRMIGIIGSKSNGKNAFLEELSMSLCGNTSLKPSFKNAFIKEYNITLPGPNEESLTLVDLPAFEDNNVYNHVSVLKAIVAYLGTQYQKGRQLLSLVWCYNISKPRFTIVDGENLNLVKDISGPEAIKNVTVLTTNWNKGAGVGANPAKPRTVAAVASPLQRYEKAESQLEALFGAGVKLKRFGTFPDSAAREVTLGSTSTGGPVELIRSLLLSEEKMFQVQREACETRKLAGTTAGSRLREKLETEIKKKDKEIQELDKELEDMPKDDTERNAIQEEKDEAKQDISRWKGTLYNIDLVGSAFTV
ncbi:hypothetical protein EST38_g10900 [Candolleomyces aberdarensis]|uniref:Peptidase C14 caspase domain-containing protein n=1 Tax=Candolleomyces aberdarensis TaxID=2316362 RepID=A0A4Q2D9I6_9AGAR|nr:hypothetical protein EST38_g10900 [Candolleomyces aberdarensis]